MKKLLLLLLIAPFIGNSQMLNLPVSNIIVEQSYELTGIEVPQGKVWQWVGVASNSSNTDYYSDVHWTNHGKVQKYHLFREGQIMSNDGAGSYVNSYFTFVEYDLDAQNLAYNLPNQIIPTLYPNPTSSLLALNSDKEYDIEVYDMAGNKVMALTGNTIDMSHLSSATYIVKALDKVENEEVSYKVVKN